MRFMPKPIPLEELSPTPKISKEKGRGYLYFFMSGHPLADKAGRVYLARHVVSVKLGRWIKANEIVRFKDGDTTNVSPNNLYVVDYAAHARETLGGGPSQKAIMTCQRPGCNETFAESPSHVERRKYCSQVCTHLARQKFSVLPEELAVPVWEFPITILGQFFGVSDKAIKKRCDKSGIRTPWRGYWQILEAGRLDPEVEKEIEELKRQARLALELFGLRLKTQISP
jgi:hypothetical protein